jgi:hypothetical protein
MSFSMFQPVIALILTGGGQTYRKCLLLAQQHLFHLKLLYQ